MCNKRYLYGQTGLKKQGGHIYIMKVELSIKIDGLSIAFKNLCADKPIRKVLELPMEYFRIQKAG